VQGLLSLSPSECSRLARVESVMSPRRLLLSCSSPVLQSLTGTDGSAIWVRAPSLVFRLATDLRGLPARPAGDRAFALVPRPLMDLALLQSLTRTNPPRSQRWLTLLGFVAPLAHEVPGSDLHRV